jgi:hypothetical protein
MFTTSNFFLPTLCHTMYCTTSFWPPKIYNLNQLQLLNIYIASTYNDVQSFGPIKWLNLHRFYYYLESCSFLYHMKYYTIYKNV